MIRDVFWMVLFFIPCKTILYLPLHQRMWNVFIYKCRLLAIGTSVNCMSQFAFYQMLVLIRCEAEWRIYASVNHPPLVQIMAFAWSAPSHYLNQCWNIVKWTLMNKLQWNFNRNSNIVIQENASKSVVCETAAMLSRPQCVKMSMDHQSAIIAWKVYVVVQTNPMPDWINITSGPSYKHGLILIPAWIRLNYTNPGYGLSLVDTLWNAGSYRQPLEQEGNPMT